MSYKYKESIKDAVDEVYNASFVDELNRKNELDEAYAKAQAYDKALNKLKLVKNHPLMDEYKVEHYNLCYQLVAECILEVQE